MFTFFFACFVFVFTVRENIVIGSIILGIFILGYLGYIVLKKEKNFQNIGIIFLGFFCALGSWIWYHYRYNISYQNPSQHLQNIFIGSGRILDRQSQNKYLFTDGNFDYLLISSSDYHIGDQLRLVGNLKWTKKEDLHLITQKNNFHQLIQSDFINFHYSFDYDKRLKMKGIHGTIFEKNAFKIDSKNFIGSTNRFDEWIRSLKFGFQSLVRYAYGDGKITGLILGMLIGDKSQISKSDYQSFIDSGLVHLIAVSGGNIIMIVVFLSFILIRIPFYIRNFLILGSIIIYGFLCGMDSSVLRAVIMGGLGMIALFRGRQIDVRRALSFAFVGMLMHNPYYLGYDIGFLFSFSAIIGLVYFGKIDFQKATKNLPSSSSSHSLFSPSLKGKGALFTKLKKQIQKIGGYVRKNYLSPTIGATLGIFPTMIFFMGKINLMGILGNLFILPLVPLIMIYGFISTLLYQVFHFDTILKIEELLIKYVYRLSKKISHYGLYMNVEGDSIKYIILIFALIRFLQKRIKDVKNQEK